MPSERSKVPAVALMGVALALTLFGLLFLNGAFEVFPYLYLLPWIVGLGLLMVAPSVYLGYKGRFSFADPLVFATFSFLFPAFVIGGIFLAGGWSQPYFFALIQDSEYNLPYTILIIALGFISLSAGYFLSVGERVGGYIADRLPVADYSSPALVVPGIILLLLGFINMIFAFALGVFGFQKGEDIAQWEGIVYMTTLFWIEGSFLLWYIIFRQRRFSLVLLPVLIILVATALTKTVFAGNRSSLIHIFAFVGLAYILSGRQFKFKQGAVAAVILLLFLMAGMIWGSTFRNIKGTETRQSVDQYTESVFRTVDQVGRTDLYESLAFGMERITERLDVLSSVAVVVSNYEELRAYEEAYGLQDNIWIDTTTFLIPRIIWKDKPYASDPRKYSDLYFNFGESSFAITPMGDLLRNFGLPGVVLGMLLIGVIIRVIYRSLVEGQKRSAWRLTLYFMLLTSISYEGFFGTIVPTLVKIGLTSVVGILIVCLIAHLLSGSKSAPAS